MKTIVVLLLIIFANISQVFAQDNLSDESQNRLITKRRVFHSDVYADGVKLNWFEIKYYITQQNADHSINLFRKSRVLSYAAPAVTAVGLGLSTLSLIGTKHAITIETGELVEYKTRPITHLITGLALTASGICLFEMANDLKLSSIKLYNNKTQDKSVSLNWGITPSDNLGIYLNL